MEIENITKFIENSFVPVSMCREYCLGCRNFHTQDVDLWKRRKWRVNYDQIKKRRQQQQKKKQQHITKQWYNKEQQHQQQ